MPLNPLIGTWMQASLPMKSIGMSFFFNPLVSMLAFAFTSTGLGKRGTEAESAPIADEIPEPRGSKRGREDELPRNRG